MTQSEPFDISPADDEVAPDQAQRSSIDADRAAADGTDVDSEYQPEVSSADADVTASGAVDDDGVR